jgi:hypothetical protein
MICLLYIVAPTQGKHHHTESRCIVLQNVHVWFTFDLDIISRFPTFRRDLAALLSTSKSIPTLHT